MCRQSKAALLGGETFEQREELSDCMYLGAEISRPEAVGNAY